MVEVSKDREYRPSDHWVGNRKSQGNLSRRNLSVLLQARLDSARYDARQSSVHTQARSAAPMLAVRLTCTTAYARHVSTRLTLLP